MSKKHKKKHYDYIAYLNECAEKGMSLINASGLCRDARWGHLDGELLSMFVPTSEDDKWLKWEKHNTAYWGSECSGLAEGELTNLRLTIVLFMAARKRQL